MLRHSISVELNHVGHNTQLSLRAKSPNKAVPFVEMLRVGRAICKLGHNTVLIRFTYSEGPFDIGKEPQLHVLTGVILPTSAATCLNLVGFEFPWNLQEFVQERYYWSIVMLAEVLEGNQGLFFYRVDY